FLDSFFLARLRAHSDLHSFPTRRSSDLVSQAGGLTSEDLLPHQAIVGQVEGELQHALRRRGLRVDLPCPLNCCGLQVGVVHHAVDRKSTRLNSSHVSISYAVFCLKKKTQ